MVTLYTYYCVDGSVRTRCHRHIEREGPYAILPFKSAIYHSKDVVESWRCVRCEMEIRTGIYPTQLEGDHNDNSVNNADR